MKTNAQKCKITSSENNDISVNDFMFEKVNKFMFLGSVAPESSSNIRRRIPPASSAFDILKENKHENDKIFQKQSRFFYTIY